MGRIPEFGTLRTIELKRLLCQNFEMKIKILILIGFVVGCITAYNSYILISAWRKWAVIDAEGSYKYIMPNCSERRPRHFSDFLYIFIYQFQMKNKDFIITRVDKLNIQIIQSKDGQNAFFSDSYLYLSPSGWVSLGRNQSISGYLAAKENGTNVMQVIGAVGRNGFESVFKLPIDSKLFCDRVDSIKSLYAEAILTAKNCNYPEPKLNLNNLMSMCK